MVILCRILSTVLVFATITDSGFIADGVLTASKFVGGVIPAPELGPNAVDTENIVAEAVETPQLADLAVTTAKIAASAVTGDKIFPGTVGATQITDGAVSRAKLADNAVVTAKITDRTVTGIKIAQATITDVNLAANSVATAQIQDGAVTAAKLDPNIVLPSGGAIFTLLWTNQAINQEFAPQTVTLDLSGYSAILLLSTHPDYETEFLQHVIIKGRPGHINCLSGVVNSSDIVYCFDRLVTPQDTGVTFGTCYEKSLMENTTYTTVNYFKPAYIYGIK